MNVGNILVIGNPATGKTTLINAVLGEDCTRTGWGSRGKSLELELCEAEGVPFRLIDTVCPPLLVAPQAMSGDGRRPWRATNAMAV